MENILQSVENSFSPNKFYNMSVIMSSISKLEFYMLILIILMFKII